MSECECESPSVAVACFRASLVLEIVTDCSSWPRARARTRPRRKIKIVAISKPSFFACVSAPSTVSSFFFSLPFLLCQSCATSVLFYLSTFLLNPIISLRSNISLKPLTLIRDYRPTSPYQAPPKCDNHDRHHILYPLSARNREREKKKT